LTTLEKEISYKEPGTKAVFCRLTMFLFVSTTGGRERATWVSFAAGERKEEDLAAKSMLKISHISPSCALMTFTKAGVKYKG
jgi:hypothetical protein